MIEIPRNTILTSDEATHDFQSLLLNFMQKNEVDSVEDVSEHYQINKDWDLIITCEYRDNILEVCIPNDNWIPSINVYFYH